MKGDPRVAAKCPLCPHVVRPTKRNKENGYVAATRTRTILRNALRQHFYWAHPEVKQRKLNELLDQICNATSTTQSQLVDPSPGPTAYLNCPVPGCPSILETWVDLETGNLVYAAKHGLRQHINHKHPGFSSRQVLEFLERAVFRPSETEAEPSRLPQGPSAGESTLPDLVAPARPDVPAHAAGKVEEPREVPPIRIIRRTSNMVGLKQEAV